MLFSPLTIFVIKDGGTSKALARAVPLPRSNSIHDFKFMDSILLPTGETLSRPAGEFLFFQLCRVIMGVQTAEQTRRQRLQILVKKYKSMAELCQLLGYARNETAVLTRIHNANIRHDRGGKPYVMGGPMARHIETVLELPEGWMDTPPTYAEILGEEDPRTKVLLLMEAMPPDQWAMAARLLDALAQPANGTSGPVPAK